MVAANDFWTGRRVLITGHTGFKGGWLTLWLRRLEANIAGFALLPPTAPSLFESARVADGLQSHIGDVRDFAALSAVFENHRPEVVFHLAAQPLVRRSYADPVETYSTNVMGTVNVLEAVRRTASVKVIVVVTSDKCYENGGVSAYLRETDALGGRDPYSSSKACADIVASAYRRSFLEAAGVACATVRAGNVLGGGDWAEDRLIPDLVRAALKGERLALRSPSAVRPWQHVLDALTGYLLLAERLWTSPDLADSYNFGPDPASLVAVGDVIRAFERHWGAPVSVAPAMGGTGSLYESAYLGLDSNRARWKLGWRPKLAFDTAIAWTAAWYTQYRDGRDMGLLTLAQINEYMNIGSGGESAAATHH